MTDSLMLLAATALTTLAFVVFNHKTVSFAPVKVKRQDERPRR